MKKQKVLYIFLGILGIAGLAGYLIKKPSRKAEKIAVVEQGVIVEAVYGIAKVIANKSFQYKTGVPTTITQIYVEEGQDVKKKTALLELDGMTKVYSPLDGTLTTLNYKAGENTVPNAIVLSVMDLRDLYLVVSLEQQGAFKVKKGQAVRVNFESFREKTFQGVVNSIYSDAKEFLVRIETEDLPANVLPGMTADVAIVIQEKKDTIIVPFAAVKDSTVKVLSDSGKIVERKIELGLVDGEKVEVLGSSLRSGDRVILSEGL